MLLPKRPDATVDLVVTDAFDRPSEIPEALTTPAFARELARVLRPTGVHVLNVVDVRGVPQARRHASTLAASVRRTSRSSPRGRCSATAREATRSSSPPRSPLPLKALADRAAGSVDREEIVDLG